MDNEAVIQRILHQIKKAVKPLPQPIKLLVCASGGADSTALLHAVHIAGIDYEVVNCNFRLRGEESDRDSRFVKRLADNLNARCHMLEFDTPGFCESRHISEEMACRELRYAEFRRLRRDLGCTRIAVAHNADDNIETMLLNLLRGTGLKGLCGMSPDDGEILRPLLETPRDDIEKFLKAIGEPYVTDSSNLSDYYKRNFLRLRVLPLIEEKWPGAKKSITSSIRNLQGYMRIVDSAINTALGDDRHAVTLAQLDAFPDRRSLLFAAFAPFGATSIQISEMDTATRPGAVWALPGGTVRLLSDRFQYSPLPRPDTQRFLYKELGMTPDLLSEIRRSTGNDTVYLPDTMESYSWRTPCEGMRISPFGMRGSRKIADVLRDARIPASERGSMPLLIENATGEVIWIPGIRRSRLATVTPQTATVTRISISSEKEEEE